MTSKASICSVTRIVAISAAIDADTLPASIRPAITGPNSLVIPSATIEATILSALNLELPTYICKAKAPPVKNAVNPMTGREL